MMSKSKKSRTVSNLGLLWVPIALMVWGMVLLAAGWEAPPNSPARFPFTTIGGIWVALGLTKLMDSQFERIRRLGRGWDFAAALVVAFLVLMFCYFWWWS